MALQEEFNQIIDYAHFWNWAHDWGEVQRIYEILIPSPYLRPLRIPIWKN